MEEPDYYDATESKVVIVPKSVLARAFNKVFLDGLNVGSLFGSGGVALSSLAVLVTSQGFNTRLGLDGSTWEAIFTLIFFITLVTFGVSVAFFTYRRLNKGFGPTTMNRRFFRDEPKVVSKNSNKKT